jgi:hypothetical protein
MRVRTWLSLFGFVLVACGSESPEEQPEAPPEGEQPSAAQSTEETSGLRLTLAGETGLLSGGAQLQVREQNPIVNLVVTAVEEDNSSNLVSLQLALMGVENAMGTHRTEIGPPGNSAAFVNAYMELQSYSSRTGTLEVTLAHDGRISGNLEVELFKDSEPGRLDESGEQLSLSGNFVGWWSLVCRSPVPGLPGDHSVSDSAYCNGLTF